MTRIKLPRRTFAKWGAAIVVAVLAGAATSCSRNRPPPLNPVKGSVIVNGKPAANAVVVLRPVSPGTLGELLPHGETGPDGLFRIGTYAAADGAPAGEYWVTITWPESRKDPTTGDDVSEDRLNGRYGDPTAPQLKATVSAGDNELPPFRLE